MPRLFLLLLIAPHVTAAWINQNKAIEDTILKKYDSRHRPVKQESTTLNIQVYLMINHIEKVDEKEQTMLLHGVLWSVWQDEYLKWDPARFNNTRAISIDPWKIWQPSFALYNSAKGNNWLINMYAMPATLSSEGRIYSSGTYSFEVTCAFDFANYPYDEQSCPIVLADWVYDLSKVNLSHNAVGKDTKFKPAIRLSFDPTDPNPKKHVSVTI
ncbi:Protein LGC-25 [Aphelenchoides avenae]|nr:Protein LGC-25 [Aphelenchus avenae]